MGSFDIVCAIEYAKLFKSLEKNALDVYRNAENIPKWKMKQDWMIAVEAKISGCSQLLNNNKSYFQNFVGEFIEILDLDDAVKEITKMESLFENEEFTEE